MKKSLIFLSCFWSVSVAAQQDDEIQRWLDTLKSGLFDIFQWTQHQCGRTGIRCRSIPGADVIHFNCVVISSGRVNLGLYTNSYEYTGQAAQFLQMRS